MDDLIKLNSPVAEVKNAGEPVRVITESGAVYECEKAIVCLPAATFHRIKFETITESKRILAENQVLCNMTRMAMVFAKPFWREKHAGYTSFSHNFPMNEVVELTPDSQQYAILAFVFTAEGFEQWNQSIL
jgi:monoamine oxidase